LIASQNFAARPIFDFPDEKSSFSFHSKRIFHGILAANPMMQRRGRKKHRTSLPVIVRTEGNKNLKTN
jgi:hypothetical protein